MSTSRQVRRAQERQEAHKSTSVGTQLKWLQFRHSREGLESRSSCYRKHWIPDGGSLPLVTNPGYPGKMWPPNHRKRSPRCS